MMNQEQAANLAGRDWTVSHSLSEIASIKQNVPAGGGGAREAGGGGACEAGAEEQQCNSRWRGVKKEQEQDHQAQKQEQEPEQEENDNEQEQEPGGIDEAAAEGGDAAWPAGGNAACQAANPDE